MGHIPVGWMILLLVLLIAMSAFFSASETSMMALNRYRLRHLAESGHRGARYAETLLAQPDRLLGLILLGNNLANNAAAAVTTVLALELAGEVAVAFAAGLITLLILIFAEIPPKTIAALHPERIAFPAAYVLTALQKVLGGVVRGVNVLGNLVPRLLGISLTQSSDALSAAELRTVVKESGRMIPESHQQMLLRILELEDITVNDVMVPRAEIEGIDLDDDWDDILEEMGTAHHTRLPVFHGSLDNLAGELHMRDVLHLSQAGRLDKDAVKAVVKEPCYIPEGSRITQQLVALRDQRRQMGMVVDEYGDIIGLVTLDEILEEIVGEFTSHVPGIDEDYHIDDDGSLIVDGGAVIRDLNRSLDWNLPTDGPKTLNGLLLEYLEEIPRPGTSTRLFDMTFEILQARGTAISVVRVWPESPEEDKDEKQADT